MRRVILKNRVMTRTSGPIPTTPAGIRLRDCAQVVVVLRFEQRVECRGNGRWLEVNGATCRVNARMKIRYSPVDREVRSRMYLSPDSISSTRRLGSSERRAARTQPAVPTGEFSRLGDPETDGDKRKLASSYDDDVVLRPKQVLSDDTVGVNLRRDGFEITKEGQRFLRGSFCCLEDEESGNDGNEGEVGISRKGRGHGCV